MTVTYRDPTVTYGSLDVTYRGADAPDFPVITTEIAITNNATDTSLVWEDVSADVDALTTRRGRNRELDRFVTGTATVRLENFDRQYDPTYTTGPFAGSLLPMKPIRITARWDAVTYPIFYGFVDGWPQEYEGENAALTYVPLTCTDLFSVLALATVSGSWPEETTGERIERVLDAVGVPAALRDIDTGNSTVSAVVLDGESALGHLQLVADSEMGMLFVGRDGKVRFIGRHNLIIAALDTSLTWGDDGTEYPYSGLTLLPDNVDLWNYITVASEGLETQIAGDSSSAVRYYQRALPTRQTVLSTTNQMFDLANFLKVRFSEPQTRIVGMTSDGLPVGQTIEESFAALLGREIGDKIRVKRRPTGGGNVISQDSVIDGIALTVAGPKFRFEFNLSPAEQVSNWWVVGTSEVGTSTRVAF